MTVEERSALGISYWKIGHIVASPNARWRGKSRSVMITEYAKLHPNAKPYQ